MSLSQEEINEIAEKHYEDVYKFCCSRTRNVDDAADLTQDTFLLFLQNRHKLENKNILSWLLKAANNLMHDYFRKRSIEKNFVNLNEAQFVSVENEFEQMDDEEFEKLLNETQKRILSILTPSEQQLFIKLYIENKSVRLVSNELGIKQESIYVMSSRIKKKVKSAFFSGKMFNILLILRILFKQI